MIFRLWSSKLLNSIEISISGTSSCLFTNLRHLLTFCCSCCWYCWASCWALLIWEVVEGLFDLSVWVAWVLMAFRFKRSTNKKWINIVTIYRSRYTNHNKNGFYRLFCNCTLHRTWYNNKRMKSFMWKSNTVCKNQKCTVIEKTFVKSICSEIYLWKSWFHGIFLKKYYDQISQIATLWKRPYQKSASNK